MVHQGEEAQVQAFILAERLRDAGLDVVLHCATPTGAGSFKSQMKKADASGAAFAVILGEDEVANKVAAVKSLRAVAGQAGEQQQASVAFDKVVDHVVDAIIGDHDHDHDHVHYHP
jgi:histidyl-tRNA synthetase